MVKCEEMLLLGTSPGKDSGFESAEELLPIAAQQPPHAFGPEQLTKIRTQVEFYLSDEVVSKDQFLLKHVTKSKEGWLSLKLMSSFRKVKGLCKGADWRVVVDALRDSESLEVSNDGTKVRRRCAAPEEDETKPARSLVVWPNSNNKVPTVDQQQITAEIMEKLFAECGAIQTTRIVMPGEVSDDITRRVFVRHPKIRQLTCAIVEFDKSESAAKALQLIASASSSTAAADVQAVLLKDCLKAAPAAKDNSGNQKTVRERRTFSDSELGKRTQAAASSPPPAVKVSSVPSAPMSWRDRSQPVEFKPRAKSFSSATATVSTPTIPETSSLGNSNSKKHQQQSNKAAGNVRNKDRSSSSASCEFLLPKEGEMRPRRFTISEAPAASSYVIRQPRGPDGTRGFKQHHFQGSQLLLVAAA